MSNAAPALDFTSAQRLIRSGCNCGGASIRRMSEALNHGSRSVRYLIIVALLFWPLAAPLWATIEWAGRQSGATLSPREMALLQERNPRILWSGTFPDYAPYKLERAKLLKPEVLVVGNSRCGQVRSAMFRPYKAYNACTSTWSFAQITQFVDLATRALKPRVVVFTLDYFLFSDAFAASWEVRGKMDYDQRIRSHFRRVNDLVTYATLFPWWHPRRATHELIANVLYPKTEKVDGLGLMGIGAIRAEHGFRYDGSTLYGPGYRMQTEAKNEAGAMDFVMAFPGGAGLSKKQITNLQRLADLSKERGFILVGVQLPILKPAVDFLDTDPNYWPYAGMWREFESEHARQLFSDMGILFFDMARDPVTSDRRNFIDPAHPSEGGTLGAFVHLLEDPRFRATLPALDVEGLKADYAKAQTALNFVDIYR